MCSCPVLGLETVRPMTGVPVACEAVSSAQLAIAWHDNSLEVDGRFGPATEARIREYQREKGLPVTGVIDPTTGGLLAIDERNLTE